jgi:hypothetical protein
MSIAGVVAVPKEVGGMTLNMLLTPIGCIVLDS